MSPSSGKKAYSVGVIYLKTKTESSLRKVVCIYKNVRTMSNVQQLNSCIDISSLQTFSYLIHKYSLSTDVSIYLSIYLWVYSPLLGPGRLFSFSIFTQSVGLLERELARREAATYTTTQR
jgi:hypothetical protein